MRIGILTQPLSRNYGGILQNYALQQVLKKMGHEPYTFDLGLYTWKDWIVASIKNIIKMFLGMTYSFGENPREKFEKEIILRRFVNNNIKLIFPRTKRPQKRKIKEYNLQAIVVGSDQVWRLKYNRNIEDMFLQFVNKKSIKKIAYAVSLGTSEWEYSEKQTNKCKFLVQNFNAVSVREDSGVELLKKYLNVSATHVLDPTLLLSLSDYNLLINNVPKRTYSILFAFLLDISDVKLKYIANLAAQLGLSLVVKSAGPHLSIDDSVEDWLSCFRDSQFVVTDSFHGVVFSLIYNREFIVIGNFDRGLDRMTSLLNICNLSERLVDEKELGFKINNNSKINWEYVNSQLNYMRSLSLNFLSSNL